VLKTAKMRLLSRSFGLAAAGLAGLALAATATSATETISVSSLAIVSGKATGTISGFQPGSSVTVNGGTLAADGSGTVNLVAASLAGANTLSIGFTDSGGTPQAVSGPLVDLTTGTQLSPAQVTDLIPNLTQAMTLNYEGSSGTTTGTTGTTGTTTTTTTTSGGGTTTGSGGGSGGSGGSGSGGSGGSGGASSGIAGAVRLADGSSSIPSSSVLKPHRLVIKQVVFKPTIVRSSRNPITIRFRVLDSRGMVVRDAAVWMRTLPLQLVTPVKAKRTSMTGWVTFTVRPMKVLKLKTGGRVNIFVRASTPGQPIIGGTSTRRIVSLRTAAGR
jgi:hypothetical protein